MSCMTAILEVEILNPTLVCYLSQKDQLYGDGSQDNVHTVTFSGLVTRNFFFRFSSNLGTSELLENLSSVLHLE